MCLVPVSSRGSHVAQKACRVAEQQSQDLGKWRARADKSSAGAIK